MHDLRTIIIQLLLGVWRHSDGPAKRGVSGELHRLFGPNKCRAGECFRWVCLTCQLYRCVPTKSAFARFVLQGQLEAVALPGAYEAGDRTDADVVFNDGQ